MDAVTKTKILASSFWRQFFTAIGGAHFLPYVWLHQTKIYLYLALGVSLGSWAITLAGGEGAYRWVMV
ncbi:DUF7010 family protein [Arthrobacter sulfonylureivorans]|uniref:DUF7010 family protein n=1 Tax=Arthrobacter sulfonylureivorans TaxID=2486855 RepID=UPI0039E6AE2F